MVKLNTYENLFVQMIDLMEFSLNKYEDGYGVINQQCANLGDIENDRFENATSLIDRLSVYINDYIIEDLEDGLSDIGVDVKYNNYKELLELSRKNIDIDGGYGFDIDLLDMILNHGDEIDIEKAYQYIVEEDEERK